MADDAQSVSDNAELEDIAKMPIAIELLNLRISRSMRRHGTIGSFIRIIGSVSYTHLDVYKRQVLYGGALFLLTASLVASGTCPADRYSPVSYTHLMEAEISDCEQGTVRKIFCQPAVRL